MSKPNFPSDIPCQCYPFQSHPCICPTEERALRAYSFRYAVLRPMSHEQRAWCLAEIGKVEGYDSKEYEDTPDHVLATTVLHVWTDYCRDKGLL